MRMKKLFFALMAVAAMTFASCGKTAAPGQADQQAPELESPEQVAPSLEEGLKSNDQGTFKAKVAAIIEKITSLVKDNPAQAKEYLGKAQEFLAANKDKVMGLVGNNDELRGLVESLSSGNFVSGLLDKLPDAVKNQIPEGAADAIGNLIGK